MARPPWLALASSQSHPPGLDDLHCQAPLDKFIRVFGLDELAATCLKKLEERAGLVLLLTLPLSPHLF